MHVKVAVIIESADSYKSAYSAASSVLYSLQYDQRCDHVETVIPAEKVIGKAFPTLESTLLALEVDKAEFEYYIWKNFSDEITDDTIKKAKTKKELEGIYAYSLDDIIVEDIRYDEDCFVVSSSFDVLSGSFDYVDRLEESFTSSSGEVISSGRIKDIDLTKDKLEEFAYIFNEYGEEILEPMSFISNMGDDSYFIIASVHN